MARRPHPLGIDVGGSGSKGAPVDLETGVFVRERLRIQTPEVSTHNALGDVVVHMTPISDLGHIQIDGFDAEKRAASSVREQRMLSWAQWAERLQRYFSRVEDLLRPDLIVVGREVSKKSVKFLPLLHLRTPFVSAQLAHCAGIVAAASLTVNDPTAPRT